MPAKLPDERQDYLADGDRVLAGLDVEIGDDRRPVVEYEFEELVGRKPVPVELTVVAAHCAIVAVLPAIAGDFHDATHEDFSAKARVAQFARRLME